MKEKKRREEKTRREKKGGEIKEMRKKEASQGIKPRTFCTAGQSTEDLHVVKALTVSYCHRLVRHLQ